MRTAIIPHLSDYTEYGRVDGGAWFQRRVVSYREVVWC